MKQIIDKQNKNKWFDDQLKDLNNIIGLMKENSKNVQN